MSSESAQPQWEELLAQTGWMRRLARQLVHDPNAADDVVQEAFVRALRFPPDPDRPLRPWLSRVVSNLVRERFRSRGRRTRREAAVALTACESSPGAEDLVEQLEQQRWLAKQLLDLEEPYRATVLLRFVEGLTSKEIAHRQGVPDSTVRWRVQEGLSRLRRRLDDCYGGDRRAWALALLPLARAPAGAASAGVVVASPWSLLLAQPAAWTVVLLIAIGGIWLLVRPLGPDPASGNRVASAPEPEGPQHQSAVGTAPDRIVAEATREPAAVEDEPTSEPATVIARFVDTEGRPISGVILRRIAGEDGNDGDLPEFEDDAYGEVAATSGEDGSVSLVVPCGESDRRLGLGRRWRTSFSMGGGPFAPRCAEAVVAAGQPTHLGRFVLLVAGTVIGHVRDQHGRPVEGVLVTARANSSEFWSRSNAARIRSDRPQDVLATTGAEGAFRLESVPTFCLVSADGRNPSTVAVDPGGMAEVELEVRVEEPFESDETIRCEVVGPEGRPVEDAELIYGGSSWSIDQTNRNGVFHQKRTSSGRLERELWVHDRAGRLAMRVFPVDTPLDTLRRIRLESAEFLEIRVRNEAGRPVTRFDAQLVANRIGILDTSERHRSDRGCWRVRRPVQPFEVQVGAVGYQQAKQGPLEPASTPATIVVTLRRLPGLSGRIVGDGRPVAAAHVYLAREAGNLGRTECLGFVSTAAPALLEEPVVTDEQGRFRVPLGDSRTVLIRAEAEGFAPAVIGPIEFDPGKGLDGLLLELEQGGTLEGRVLVPAGVDPAGLIVGVSCGDGFPKTQRVGPDGRYEFHQLRPGSWEVAPCRYEMGPLADDVHQRSKYGEGVESKEPAWDCEIRAGAVTTFDLDLRDRDACVLYGQIDARGLSAPQAWSVSVRQREMRYCLPDSYHGGTAADGTFLCRLEAGGPHAIRVSANHGPLRNLSIAGEIELHPGDNEWHPSFHVGTLEVQLPAGLGVGPVVHVVHLEGGVRVTTLLRPEQDGVARALVPAGPAQIIHQSVDAYNSRKPYPVLREVIVPAGGAITVEVD